MMSPEIVNLIEQARSAHHEAAANAVTSIALLLERTTTARDSDANYAELLPDALFRHGLPPAESQALIITLSEILKTPEDWVAQLERGGPTVRLPLRESHTGKRTVGLIA